MLHTIIIDYKYRNKICLLFDNIKYTKEQILKQNELHENHTDIFRDINGEIYVVCHGSCVEIKGKKYGYLNYLGDPITTPGRMYRDLISRQIIKSGEIVNLICCHGAVIKATYEECCDNPVPVNYVNNTDSICYSSIIKLRNGRIKYVCGTQNTKKEKVKYMLECSK